jgi:hypothetical protein
MSRCGYFNIFISKNGESIDENHKIFRFLETFANLRKFALRPPRNKILEESTLLSEEVKQTDKEIPSTRPCWMDWPEV